MNCVLSKKLNIAALIAATLTPSLSWAADKATDAAIAQIQENLNFLWVLIAAAMVFLMQAGFMCVESGYARAKNSINVAIKNMADFILSVSAFWAVGFGLMFGTSIGGWIGGDSFFLNADNPWATAFFIFQAVFCGTAATIDSGAIAGRAKFGSYLVISTIISAIIYPIFGHWAWGSLLGGSENAGWLEGIGFIDFAGSTVVHSVGGWVALAGLLVIGPRIGRFNKDGSVNNFPPNSRTLAYLGTFILFFGWFGFNCGSTLAADTSIAKIALNTIIGACFGGLTATAASWIISPDNRPEGEHIANGLLGGLVGVTAGCEILVPWSSAVVGVGAGLVSLFSMMWLEKMKIDDAVSAVPVHGFCGAWGTIALAIFMPTDRVGEAGRMMQVGIQTVGVLVGFVWAFGASYILLSIVNRFMGLRVTEEEENMGLNIAEHGARSSVLELANKMRISTHEKRYDESLEIPEEIGTEVGDLISGYNSMLRTVRSSIEASEAQTLRAKEESERAEEALESTKTLLAKLEETKEKSKLEREAFLLDTSSQVFSLLREIENNFNRIDDSSEQVSEALSSLDSKTRDIFDIIGQIGGISRQTRLLSINASIESERAGEAGRTFSAVAKEVQKLSNATQKTTASIGGLVESIQEELKRLSDKIAEQSQKITEGMESSMEAKKVVNMMLSAKEEGEEDSYKMA